MLVFLLLSSKCHNEKTSQRTGRKLDNAEKLHALHVEFSDPKRKKC